MRIASLQPSISITLAHLGALDALCAVTKFCVEAVPELAVQGVPVLHDSWAFPEADVQTLLGAKPDLVVASVPYRLEALTAILKAGLPVLTLAPYTLDDIYKDTRLLARQVDALDRAEELIARLTEAVAEAKARCASLPSVAVYCEEWGKPLIASQPWIAELIAAANGRFVGVPGKQTTAEAVAEADPDVLLFAWCGAGDRVPLERVVTQRGWEGLRAVQAGRVYCIPDEFLNTPSFNLQDGLTAILQAVRPGLYAGSERVRQLGESSQGLKPDRCGTR